MTPDIRIGIPIEPNPLETRIAVTPPHVASLVKRGYSVVVEENAGQKSGYTNEMYDQVGASIVGPVAVYEANAIVRVKRPELGTIRDRQKLAGSFLLLDKGRDPEMLDTLQRRRNTALAYHRITDTEGRRLVTQSAEAGLVGMYEGIRLYGQLQGQENIYAGLPSSWDCGSSNGMIQAIKTIGEFADSQKPVSYILGDGIAARGARQLLTEIGLPYKILRRAETAQIEKYLPKADILVNTVSWEKGDPPVITKDMLELIRPSTPIIDVSCITAGPIETTTERDWTDPLYVVDGVTHFSVTNLPAAIGNESSRNLSNGLIPYIGNFVAGQNVVGLIAREGKYIPHQTGTYK